MAKRNFKRKRPLSEKELRLVIPTELTKQGGRRLKRGESMHISRVTVHNTHIKACDGESFRESANFYVYPFSTWTIQHMPTCLRCIKIVADELAQPAPDVEWEELFPLLAKF